MLNLKDLKYKEDSIKVGNKRIQLYIFGEGQHPVICFPSYPTTGLYYLWLFNGQHQNSFRFITLDMPGWIGLSSKYRKGEYFKMEDYIKIGQAVINHFRLHDFSILGFSFGGALSIRLAADNLSRGLKNVVLISAVVNGQKEPLRRFKLLVWLGKKLGAYSIAKSYINKYINAYARQIAERTDIGSDLLEFNAKLMRGMQSHIVLDSAYEIFKINWIEYLKQLKSTKVLVINSLQEETLFRKQAEIIRRTLNKDRSTHFRGSHQNFMINPDRRVVKEILDFLRN